VPHYFELQQDVPEGVEPGKGDCGDEEDVGALSGFWGEKRGDVLRGGWGDWGWRGWSLEVSEDQAFLYATMYFDGYRFMKYSMIIRPRVSPKCS